MLRWADHAWVQPPMQEHCSFRCVYLYLYTNINVNIYIYTHYALGFALKNPNWIHFKRHRENLIIYAFLSSPRPFWSKGPLGLYTLPYMYEVVYTHYNKCFLARLRRPIGHQIAKPTCPAIEWYLRKGKLWFGLALRLCKCFDHDCHFWSWCASCLRLLTRGQWGKHYKLEPAWASTHDANSPPIKIIEFTCF